MRKSLPKILSDQEEIPTGSPAEGTLEGEIGDRVDVETPWGKAVAQFRMGSVLVLSLSRRKNPGLFPPEDKRFWQLIYVRVT